MRVYSSLVYCSIWICSFLKSLSYNEKQNLPLDPFNILPDSPHWNAETALGFLCHGKLLLFALPDLVCHRAPCVCSGESVERPSKPEAEGQSRGERIHESLRVRQQTCFVLPWEEKNNVTHISYSPYLPYHSKSRSSNNRQWCTCARYTCH